MIGSTCAVIIGLSWGGVEFPWNSAQVISALTVGCVGLAVFVIYEWRFAKYPVVRTNVIDPVSQTLNDP